MPKGHTFTCHHQFEKLSCSTVQSRPTHEAHLQQGSTNPEYKSTQQDLTEIKTERLRNAGSGNQGRALAIIKVLLHKSSLTSSLYQHFIFKKIIYKADMIHNEIMKLHIQHLLKFQLLTTLMNSELSLHNRGAITIRTD